MVTSAGGVLSWKNRMRNDGTAITTRMTTGITVQATSSSVLCVVRDGVGLVLALNFTITISNSASTNSVMIVMTQSRKSWNQVMSSMVGAADFWKPICHGTG